MNREAAISLGHASDLTSTTARRTKQVYQSQQEGSLMRTLILAIILSSAAGMSIHAQQPSKMLFWTGDPGCGYRSGSFTASDSIGCSSVVTERGPVSQVSVNGVGLAAAFLEKDDYMIVGAHITNSTAEPIMFDTDDWGAAHFKTRSEFSSGEEPIVAETSIPTRDLIRSAIFGAKLGAIGDKMIAEGQVKSETREIRRSDGTRFRVDVIVPDTEAQKASIRRSQTEMEQVIKEQARIRDAALTAKSVRPNQSVTGLVYFRRVKEAEFVVFSLSVGDITYVFRLPSKK